MSNLFLVHVTKTIARIASLLGHSEDALRYAADHARLRQIVRHEYIAPSGRVASDTQTAYILALAFGLFESHELAMATKRLDWLIRWNAFNISTGFAGTFLILDTLAENGMINLAYRMLQERDNPSWLYPISMGATTIVSLRAQSR